MNKILLSLLLSAVVLLSQSCYYDKEELLYQGSASAACADTVGTVSYTQKIVPVFNRLCYSCHAGNSPSGNILMGTYAADKAIGQNGKLYGSINHTAGYIAMPQGAPKMSVCEIAMIKKWVDAGMLNN